MRTDSFAKSPFRCEIDVRWAQSDSEIGPSHHLAAARQFGRIWTDWTLSDSVGTRPRPSLVSSDDLIDSHAVAGSTRSTKDESSLSASSCSLVSIPADAADNRCAPASTPYSEAAVSECPGLALRVARGMSAILSLSDHNGHWPELMLNGSVANDPGCVKTRGL